MANHNRAVSEPIRRPQPQQSAASESFTLDSGSGSPNSTSSLLVVEERPESDSDDPDSPLLFPHFDSDDEEEGDEYDHYIPHDQRPLSPANVILLLLGPSLRLGAILLPSISSETKFVVSIPCLVLAVLLGVFTRHLWVMLALYVRKISVEDVCCEALVRLGAGRRWRGFTKGVVRGCGVGVRGLIVVVYWRAIHQSLAPLLPQSTLSLPILSLIAFILLTMLMPSTASLSSPRTAFLSLLSLIACTTWLILTLRSKILGHAPSTPPNTLGSHIGISGLWDVLTTSLFLSAGFPPLGIYASLATYRYPATIVGAGGVKKKKRSSFGTLSLVAASLSLGLTLPVLFLKDGGEVTSEGGVEYVNPGIYITRSLVLFFALPESVASLPRLPYPSSRMPRMLQSQIPPRALLVLGCMFASFIPSMMVMSVLSSVMLIMVLLSTYILPSALHILYHNLFRPTSIIFHQNSQSLPPDAEDGAQMLLYKKERALQKKRLLRRVVWDVGVWVVLVGAGVWAVGRVGRWWWWM